MAYLGYRALLVTAFSIHESGGKVCLNNKYIGCVVENITTLNETVHENFFDIRINNVYQSMGTTVLHTIIHIDFESKQAFHVFKLKYPEEHDYLSLLERHTDENLQLMWNNSTFLDRTVLVKERLNAYF